MTTFTHPDVFAAAARGEFWADPQTDPTRIDWTSRRARALIPFDVIDGRPVRPGPPTGIRHGRNELGHWGEQACADAMVTAVIVPSVGVRVLAMVKRADGHGWALPGGYIDPGETPPAAAIRELAEETGLVLPTRGWHTDPARLVDDPRGSDEAWMVTTLSRYHLGAFDHDEKIPTLIGADDATEAAWMVADTYDTLVDYLALFHSGEIFPAHRAILTTALSH